MTKANTDTAFHYVQLFSAVDRRFWQRRFYDFNVWSRKKRIEN